MNRRVVITGLGTVNPLGNNTKSTWEAATAGVNGIGPITRFDTENFKVKLAAEVKNFDPLVAIEAKDVRRLDLFSQYAVVSALEAMADSGLDKHEMSPFRRGVVIGSGIGGFATIQKNIINLINRGPSRVEPYFIPMAISNMAAGNVAIYTKSQGYCTTIVTACATGTNSIGDGYNLIKSGQLDVCIAGGSEASIVEATIAGFTSLQAISTNPDVNRASIPFDKERSGFVIGEGAATLILEEYEHAKARNASIYAEIVGYGATCDASHITAPNLEGVTAAIEMAIERASIEPSEIGYINAHGTSTDLNDKIETEAIKIALKGHAKNVAISSTKSMTGHLFGGAGALEAIFTVLSLKDSIIPPTINYQISDENCDLNYTPNLAIKKDIKYALSNSLGFGGHNAVLAFKKYEGK